MGWESLLASTYAIRLSGQLLKEIRKERPCLLISIHEVIYPCPDLALPPLPPLLNGKVDSLAPDGFLGEMASSSSSRARAEC